MADARDRAKEVLIYAPVGLAYFLRDTTPTFMQMFVARGRSVVTQYEHSIDAEIARARSVGQLTVMFGWPEVEKRLTELRNIGESLVGEQLAAIWPALSASTAPTSHGTNGTSTNGAPKHPGTPPIANGVAQGSATRLGIDAYDSLSASQVIERLGDLDAQSLDAIAEYELAHRNRKTILGRIEQLRRPV